MKIKSDFIKLAFTILMLTCSNFVFAQRYIFFLHNKFIEENELSEAHPDYGKAEYEEILDFFTKENFVVISEKRPKDTDAKLYAQKVVSQMDSLIKLGTKPGEITVIGTSKGGYIAQYVSTYFKNKDVNYVFIGSCDEQDTTSHPDIGYSGNILSIYEKSDVMLSCLTMKNKSGDAVNRFKEIALDTGLKHGFLFKALPEWLEPSAQWANQIYGDEPVKEKVITKRKVKSVSEIKVSKVDAIAEIDSLITARNPKPFNGIILISQDGLTRYVKLNGYADIAKKKPLKFDDQFVVGSVSKQFTAVLLLREYEQGRVQLTAPVSYYLPGLNASWADSVTVNQLLIHTHGISSLDKPLDFKPGTQFAYSQIGYDLLARIIEKTSGKSFAQQAADLFKKCKMYNTSYPYTDQHKNLVPGYTELENGNLGIETRTFQNYVAAGSFISTAYDLMLWNNCLHEGKMLSPDTYKVMIDKKPVALRNHPIFGEVAYGYGITVDTQDDILQLGQTGFAPGFISMNFYFPETKTSIIALDNVVWDEDDLVKAFSYHTEILQIIRNSKFVKSSQKVLSQSH